MTASESLTAYYMIDPWRHLEDWNKPANHEHAVLDFQETVAKTDFAATKRILLRGKTTEVAEKLADGELDFVYIDGDRTLQGIAIDLMRRGAGYPIMTRVTYLRIMTISGLSRDAWQNGMQRRA